MIFTTYGNDFYLTRRVCDECCSHAGQWRGGSVSRASNRCFCSEVGSGLCLWRFCWHRLCFYPWYGKWSNYCICKKEHIFLRKWMTTHRRIKARSNVWFFIGKTMKQTVFGLKSELFWEMFFNGIERRKGGYSGMWQEVVVVVVVVWFGLFVIFPFNSRGNATWTPVQPVHVVAQKASLPGFFILRRCLSCILSIYSSTSKWSDMRPLQMAENTWIYLGLFHLTYKLFHPFMNISNWIRNAHLV